MSISASVLLNTAIDAAQKAGQILLRAAPNVSQLTIEQKSLNDFVSEVDRKAEQSIVNIIQDSFPSHRVIGEEFGEQGEQGAEVVWYVDPLDGTTNFLRSIPHYCVSIAAYHQQLPLVAVVFDPVKQEMFTAVADAGAYLNGAKISVASSRSLHGTLLATGVPYSGQYLDRLPVFLHTMQELLGEQTSGIRRLGSAALDLAYVAAGRYDGYWEAGLKPWDIAAGILLVQEAGGTCSDLLGEQNQLKCGDTLAANAKVHKEMLAITKSHYSQA